MNQCLHCKKPCAATSLLCEECWSLWRNGLQPERELEDPTQFDLRHTSLWQEGNEASPPQLQPPEQAHPENLPASPVSIARESQQGSRSASAVHHAPNARRSAPPATPNVWHELMDGDDERDPWANQ